MSSRERMILKVVLWLVNTYLQKRYRLMTPDDLNQVVDNYLAELPKLGIRLVYDRNHVGDSNDKVTANDSSVFQEDEPPRQSDKPTEQDLQV